jgi:hypothetical protein
LGPLPPPPVTIRPSASAATAPTPASSWRCSGRGLGVVTYLALDEQRRVELLQLVRIDLLA